MIGSSWQAPHWWTPPWWTPPDGLLLTDFCWWTPHWQAPHWWTPDKPLMMNSSLMDSWQTPHDGLLPDGLLTDGGGDSSCPDTVWLSRSLLVVVSLDLTPPTVLLCVVSPGGGRYHQKLQVQGRGSWSWRADTADPCGADGGQWGCSGPWRRRRAPPPVLFLVRFVVKYGTFERLWMSQILFCCSDPQTVLFSSVSGLKLTWFLKRSEASFPLNVSH